jgi:hypothetical protein
MMPDLYKRREFEPYEKIDLTTFFDKVDFGFELTGNWEKDEGRFIVKQLEEMGLIQKGKRQKAYQPEEIDTRNLDISSLDSE